MPSGQPLSPGFHISNFHLKKNLYIKIHTQGAEVTKQLRVNGKVLHLRRCTLEHQSLALKRKHRVHKYVNTAAICVSVINYSYSRKYPDNYPESR